MGTKVAYPGYWYHEKYEPRIFHSVEELEAAGPGWLGGTEFHKNKHDSEPAVGYVPGIKVEVKEEGKIKEGEPLEDKIKADLISILIVDPELKEAELKRLTKDKLIEMINAKAE